MKASRKCKIYNKRVSLLIWFSLLIHKRYLHQINCNLKHDKFSILGTYIEFQYVIARYLNLCVKTCKI